jgi:hypothetical protein
MTVERTRAETADIISTFLRGDGSAWAWETSSRFASKIPLLTRSEPNAPLCRRPTRQPSAGAIAATQGWQFFILLPRACVVPSYNSPLERTGFAARSTPFR